MYVPGSQTQLRIRSLGDRERTSLAALSTKAVRVSGGTGYRCWRLLNSPGDSDGKTNSQNEAFADATHVQTPCTPGGVCFFEKTCVSTKQTGTQAEKPNHAYYCNSNRAMRHGICTPSDPPGPRLSPEVTQEDLSGFLLKGVSITALDNILCSFALIHVLQILSTNDLWAATTPPACLLPVSQIRHHASR